MLSKLKKEKNNEAYYYSNFHQLSFSGQNLKNILHLLFGQTTKHNDISFFSLLLKAFMKKIKLFMEIRQACSPQPAMFNINNYLDSITQNVVWKDCSNETKYVVKVKNSNG